MSLAEDGGRIHADVQRAGGRVRASFPVAVRIVDQTRVEPAPGMIETHDAAIDCIGIEADRRGKAGDHDR